MRNPKRAPVEVLTPLPGWICLSANWKRLHKVVAVPERTSGYGDFDPRMPAELQYYQVFGAEFFCARGPKDNYAAPNVALVDLDELNQLKAALQQLARTVEGVQAALWREGHRGYAEALRDALLPLFQPPARAGTQPAEEHKQ